MEERIKSPFGCASLNSVVSAAFSLGGFPTDFQLLAVIDQPCTDHIKCLKKCSINKQKTSEARKN